MREMRIIGHGVDLIELGALATMRSREQFETRCFTAAERADAGAGPSALAFLAGRFAAKEATLKALGTGLVDGISLQDIEVRRTPTGAPSITLHGGVALIAQALGVETLFVSISHSESVALASVLVVAKS